MLPELMKNIILVAAMVAQAAKRAFLRPQIAMGYVKLDRTVLQPVAGQHAKACTVCLGLGFEILLYCNGLSCRCTRPHKWSPLLGQDAWMHTERWCHDVAQRQSLREH